MSHRPSRQLSLSEYLTLQERKAQQRAEKDKNEETRVIPEMDDDGDSETGIHPITPNRVNINETRNKQPDVAGYSEVQSCQMKAADRARHLYPDWIADPISLAPDGISSFYEENGGIYCRICQTFREHLKSSRKQFIEKPAVPTHGGTLFDHIGTDVHTKALGLWIRRMEQIDSGLSIQDKLDLEKHDTNEIHAVNLIAHNHLSITLMKPLCNLLDTVSRSNVRSKAKETDYRKFWTIAQALDTHFHHHQTRDIQKRTPISVTLDTSTDHILTSVLAVNLRFLSKSNEIVVLLAGLEELKSGGTGHQLYSTFLEVIQKVGIDLQQIVSVSTDGDPAMVGSQNGFKGRLKQDLPLVFHQHCGAHRYNLSLRESFENEITPNVKTLINNCVSMIHSITNSASYTRDFAQKMKDRGHSRTRLTKPLRIRWHTCQSTVSEMFDYGDIILSILSKDTNTTVQSLCAYFMQPKTILLLPIVNHLLTMCKAPLLELQARDITFIQCKEIIQQLRSDLTSINEEVFRQHLPACCQLLDSDPLHVQIDEVLAESQTVVRILQRSLEDRFLTPDETSQLDFISSH
ncbi:hypothetical protein BLNAU_19895 [Blattamonas nauphoetae]|uniref:DUF4371 domain-containing protein n=1 Tax=Blattamonas nauphoetae TaxID=2049346 RepID=A0ABQ9X3H4_9EUKA|nr:hypothetical protein BLNAU_19895 [Blattamonas nauphoetae]